MTVGDIVKKAPNSILTICGTTFGIALVAAVTFLSSRGADTEGISRLLNTILNFASVILSGGAFATAAAAASSAKNTEDQTNGKLTATVQNAVSAEIAKHLGGRDNDGGQAL